MGGQLPKQIFKFIAPFVFWPVIVSVVKNGINYNSFRDLLVGYILPLDSPGAAMWFLKSLGFMMIIIGCIRSNRELIIADFIFGILYLIGIAISTYSGLIDHSFIGQTVMDRYYSHLGSTRNVLFSGFFVILGYSLKKFDIVGKMNKYGKALSYCMLCFSFLISICEWAFIKNNASTYGEFSFYYISPLLCGFLLLTLLQMNLFVPHSTKIFRILSTGIYYSHMTFVVIFEKLVENISVLNTSYINNTVVKTVFVLFFATALTYLANKSKSKLLKMLF